MAEVFLSYSRQNARQVLDICAELDRRGLSYWRDERDIPVSVPWFEEVRGAIRAAALFVACDSYEWFESQPCQLEFETAQDLDKTIVHIDVRAQQPTAAVDRIADALSRQTELDRSHTDILVRAAAWDRRGRGSHDLVGGALLRRLGKVRVRPLTAEARAFLAASTRRNRRRRVLAAGGAVVLIVAFLAINVFVGAWQLAEEKFATAAQELNDITTIHNMTETNVYAGLQAATANVHAGNGGFLTLTVLQEALDIPVPDRSDEQPGPAPVGFRTGVITADPITVNEAGAMSNDGPGWPAPVTAITASATGAIAVAATANGLTALVNNAVVDVPCDGDAATVSLSGATMATIQQGQVCIWRPRTGTHEQWRVETPGGVALAVSDEYVVVGDDSGLTVFTTTGEQVASKPGPAVDRLSISPDGKLFAVAWADRDVVEIRQTATAALHRRIANGAPIRALRFSPDSRTLATSHGISVRLWDITTGQLKVPLRGNIGDVRELAWSADGTRVWALAGQRRVTGWQWRHGTRLHDDPTAWFVALSQPGPDGKLIAVTQSGSLLTVDPATTTMTPLAQTTATKVITAATDADHQHVVLAAAEVLTVHDIGLGVSRTVPMDECVPVSISFVPHSTLLMVACRQADLRTVDTATGRTIATTMLPYGGASTVTVAPNGEVYATGMTGLLYRTEPQLKTKHALENFRATPNLWQSIAISGDGNVMVLVGDGTGRISRTTVGRRTADGTWDWYMVDLPTRPGLQSRAVAVNKDGSVAAIGLSDGAVHFWLPLASNPGLTYTEVTGAVRGLAFTGTGTNVVAVTRDGVVDALPGCPSCGSGTALAAEAEARVDAAERMGLIAR